MERDLDEEEDADEEEGVDLDVDVEHGLVDVLDDDEDTTSEPVDSDIDSERDLRFDDIQDNMDQSDYNSSSIPRSS